MTGIQSAVEVSASAFLLGLVVWCGRRIFRPRPSFLDNPLAFFALVFAAMLALRWARIFLNAELNPDESQMLAQAMRFMSHPVPWRDVDGTTSGPLNSLILCVPMWCGAPASWATARLLVLVANCGVLLFCYGGLRFFGRRHEAQFVLMPLVFFYAFTTSNDFVHFSSETLPSVLLAASFYCFAKQWVASRVSAAGMLVPGILLGAIPFAKLQAAPLAAFLMLAGLLLIYARRHQQGRTWRSCPPEVASLAVGIAIVPVLILGVVAANGAFGDFWKSYVLSSSQYAGAEHALSSGKFANLPDSLKRVLYVGYVLLYPPNLGMFFLSGMGALIVLAMIHRAKKIAFPSVLVWPFVVVMLHCGVTGACFFVAGKPFAHYGTLIVPPLALLIGLVFFAGKAIIGLPAQAESKPGAPARRWLVAFSILAIGLQVYLPPLRIYQSLASGGAGTAPWASSVSGIARSASRTGDTLSVWGWMPECYVRTRLPPATRDAVGHYVVSNGPYQEYYWNRHLHDLERNRPAIFIDAVGDGAFLCWNQWTAANRHESFPALTRFVEDNYALLASVQMAPEVKVGPIRVYVLKQRLAELHISPADSNAPPVNDFPPWVK